MSKLKLNKKTLSILDKNQLESVQGGCELELAREEQQFTSLFSCKRTRRNCCGGGTVIPSGCLTC